MEDYRPNYRPKPFLSAENRRVSKQAGGERVNPKKLKSPYSEQYQEILKGKSLIERLEEWAKWFKKEEYYTTQYITQAQVKEVSQLLQDALDQIRRQ